VSLGRFGGAGYVSGADLQRGYPARCRALGEVPCPALISAVDTAGGQAVQSLTGTSVRYAIPRIPR
jgi:hypothetical protein